ncbi:MULTISPECIES: DUF1093 domain-containing protein [Bacillus]|uniref:DUF1093 domain-containing protein n=1 Tax=Bacillus TaxID=1386 RepID=UPI0004048D52|nr:MULTISPECIES: DUF1093 domain-containing protein [Bacillus]QHZ44982.1 DUF1093 domain-containing protein [Bacillus sp. NSP9.1]WFA05218.1 DUF1093 domain-containing protein [Bacillus sp. HSf4]
MKKPNAKWLAAVLIAVAAVFALQKLTGGLVPIADEVIQSMQQHEYYAKTTENAVTFKNGKYVYQLTGFDAGGNGQPFKTELDHKLHPGAYLKIKARGTKESRMFEIKKEAVPEGALAKLES